MSRISKLLLYSDDEKRAILKHYNVTDTDMEDMIQQLRKWMVKTPLPLEVFNNNSLKTLLFSSKMSMERAKKSLEAYIKLRTVHSDFFDRLLPTTEEYNRAKTLVKSVIMPKLSPDLCRVTIFRIDDPQGEATDGFMYLLTALMVTELRIISDDYFLSNIIIVDLSNFDAKHLMKLTVVVSKLANQTLAVRIGLKNIHMVNLPPVFDRVMTVLTHILPGKFLQKIHRHDSFESLYGYIPKEYLPSNYGGTQSSIEELQEEWCDELVRHEEDFRRFQNAKCYDLIRNTTENRDQYGVEGSFKKINID